MGADVLLGHSQSSPDIASGSLEAAPRRRRRFGRFAFWSLIVLLAICAIVAIGYELQTSALQAYLLPRYTAKVTYNVADGASASIAFPRSAPSRSTARKPSARRSETADCADNCGCRGPAQPRITAAVRSI